MPQVNLQKQSAGGFLGVNLRQDRVSLADKDVAKAINADFHVQPGAIIMRLGRTKQFTPALTDLTIRRLQKINTHRYQVAGRSVYRDQALIIPGLLHTNLVTALVPYRPLNETNNFAFIADDAGMWKDNGTTRTNWGLVAPSATPVTAAGAGGTLAGAYAVVYTYIRKVGTAAVAESNPSPASNSTTLSSQQLSVTGLTDSVDVQITHKRLYRTASGGSVYLFDQDIAVGTTTATSSVADTSLGVAVDLTGNAPPPNASFAELFNDTIFLCRDAVNPHYLWFSKRFNPESVPPTNFLEIGSPDDPLQCVVQGAGILGVFAKRTKYRVFGNAISGYAYEQSFSQRGTLAYNAVIGTPRGIIFPALDGVFSTNMITDDQNFAHKVLPLFLGFSMNGFDPINWTVANVMGAGAFKERYYLSYASGTNTAPDKLLVYSTHTQNWYHYDHPMQSFWYENDIDQFTAGGLDGFVYILENGTTDAGANIALTVDTKDFQGLEDPVFPMRKLFLHGRVDADSLGDTLNIDFYVDDVLKTTWSFTNNGRTTKLFQCPQGSLGVRWRMTFRYTGSKQVKIYDSSALYLPLEPA